jgi:membrane dipeptidase
MHEKLKIIDLHCDTILGCYTEKKHLWDYPGHISAEKLKTGESLAQCFALFIPTRDSAVRHFGGERDAWEVYQDLLRCYRENMAACADVLRPALSPADIRKNREAGYISSILTVEDGVEIDGRMERLEKLYCDGVRMIALTWNYENCFGFPNSHNQEEHTKKGLKPFGFEAVERMNKLGIIVDVSHLSEAGFYDVARHSTKPFAASHSCCRALADHPRNLTDDQLRTIGETGSVVGINFYDLFLGAKPGYTGIEDIIRHMVHAKNKAGIESVALGSDFDGIESTLEFGDYSGFPLLLTTMKKAFTEDEIDLICEKNFLRVFSAS